MSRRATALGLAAVAIAIVIVPVASGARKGRTGLHDARYCEILELKTLPPDAQVVVWNTIGQNTCPAKQWDAFDAGELAKELGDALVLLNGPRHFLMDAASAEVGKVRAFHGMKMTRVAAIHIPTAADLDQSPYRDRTISRTNTWSWDNGRKVFELVAPGGDTYIMQSYSQILDRTLKIGDLPGLASRLKLPAGWKYRSRTLTKPLVLDAKGSATIMQDDLKNTYQLATTPRRNAHPASHKVDVAGKTHSVPNDGPAGTVEDHGTLTGTPFGKGTIVLKGSLAGGSLEGTYRLLFANGSVSGTVSAPYTISGGEIDFVGTGKLTGGTGAFRGITSGTLKVHDHNTVDGQNGVLEVTGSARY